MQASEYIQIVCAVAGLAGITWARVSFTRRAQADPAVCCYSVREAWVYRASWVVIGVALVLVFFPF